MPDPTAPDAQQAGPRHPDWPLPDLLRAAEAHWDDAARLRLLARDLAPRADAGARELLGRVTARLRDLPPDSRIDPQARPRVIRRDPAFARVHAAPLPQVPTPEMAALLRQLALERASTEHARQEAATLRQRLSESRAPETDEGLRRDLEAAREEARKARQEATRLAERLAFASTPAGRPHPSARPETSSRPDAERARTDPARPGADSFARSEPARPHPLRRPPAPDPAYAELGLSPDMPDDLLPVLERALLRHHHPDRAEPQAREAATRRFQSVTLAFQRIRKLRGLG